MLNGNSLKRRAVIFASCVVLLFLSIAGWTLYKAFADSFQRNAESAMQAQIVSLLSSMDFDEKDGVYFDSVPFPELSIANSGVYAEIWRGSKLLWRSGSLIGRSLPQVFAQADNYQFHDKHASAKKYLLSTLIEWQEPTDEVQELSFISAVDSTPYLQQISSYGRSIVLWLALLGGLLILLQVCLFSWLFRPLNKVVEELQEIEKGEKVKFDDDYPKEIQGLTNSLNQYVLHEKQQIAKQKESLDNLAHSLKTPVAVIQNAVQSENESSAVDKKLINEQLHRIDNAIEYQLNKANLAVRTRYHTGKKVTEEVQRIVNAIGKLSEMTGKTLLTEIDGDVEFFGEVGDLIELIGNLLENANKWAKSTIVVQFKGDKASRRILLDVIDDGPGISEDKVDEVTQRGLRLDQKKEGHGIGLSIVADIVESYGGQLSFERSKGTHATHLFTNGLHVAVLI